MRLAAGPAGQAASQDTPPTRKAAMPTHTDAVVIGAGLAGLSAAVHLHQAGLATGGLRGRRRRGRPGPHRPPRRLPPGPRIPGRAARLPRARPAGRPGRAATSGRSCAACSPPPIPNGPGSPLRGIVRRPRPARRLRARPPPGQPGAGRAVAARRARARAGDQPGQPGRQHADRTAHPRVRGHHHQRAAALPGRGVPRPVPRHIGPAVPPDLAVLPARRRGPARRAACRCCRGSWPPACPTARCAPGRR